MAKVNNRQIFYISAFDPRGASSFWQLYNKESKAQSILTNSNINIGKRKKKAKFCSNWEINYSKGNAKTNTDFNYLHWDDIIRKHWVKSPFKMMYEGIKCNWHYGSSGCFMNVLRLCWPPGLSGAMPLIVAIGTILFAILIALTAYIFLPFSPIIGSIISIIIFALTFKISITLANRFNLFWILRGHIFFSNLAKKGNKEVDIRINEFAEFIIKNSDNKYDETLIISHCMGTNLAASVISKIIQEHPKFDISKIKFLSMAQVIPWLSFLPEAKSFQNDLKVIADSKVKWVDISSPADYICFAMTDPYAMIDCEISNPVKILNPKFHNIFNPDEYKKMKKDRLRIHFQYFMAGDNIAEYDFYQITASNQILEENIKEL